MLNTVRLHNLIQSHLIKGWALENGLEVSQAALVWIQDKGFGRTYRETWFGLFGPSEEKVQRFKKAWAGLGQTALNEYTHIRFAENLAKRYGLYFETAPERIDIGLQIDAVVVNPETGEFSFIQFTERDKEAPPPVKTLDGVSYKIFLLKGQDIQPFFEKIRGGKNDSKNL